MKVNLVILFDDLRLDDNPALFYASKDASVIVVYIKFGDLASEIGGASRWWLYHSLKSFDIALNGALNYWTGEVEEVLQLAINADVASVYFNNAFAPKKRALQQKLVQAFNKSGIASYSYFGSVIFDPESIKNKSGGLYQIFTPFYNHCMKNVAQRKLLPKPNINAIKLASSLKLDDLNILPKGMWHSKFHQYYIPSEENAHKVLHDFIQTKLSGYQEGRDIPALDKTSGLSIYLRFGQISALRLLNVVQDVAKLETSLDEDAKKFEAEVIWREFSYYTLYHFATLEYEQLKPKPDSNIYTNDQALIKAWQSGKTGYPFIDAAMRQLWETGYMHNRLRMVVASFLIKNLLVDWRIGAAWFMDCLLDADIASNYCNWQWVAGCGTDAMPYNRVFNPRTQGEKFDPQGEYVKKFVPELKSVPSSCLYNLKSAPKIILDAANVNLGANYPHEIVDLSISRNKFLELLN